MPKPICVKCHTFFRPKKNGFYFLEGMPLKGALPGLAEPDRWMPYKIWSADLWECQSCGTEIVVGVGAQPLGIQHERDFHDKIRSFGADQFQVNDC